MKEFDSEKDFYEIIGYKFYSFNDQRSNKLVEGCSIYVIRDLDKDSNGDSDGKMSIKYSISKDLYFNLKTLHSPLVGLKIKFYFNEYRKVINFEILDKEEF